MMRFFLNTEGNWLVWRGTYHYVFNDQHILFRHFFINSLL